MVRTSPAWWAAGGLVAAAGVHAARTFGAVRPQLWRPELLSASSVSDERDLADLREMLGLPTGGRPGVEVTRRTAVHGDHRVPVLWFEPRRRTGPGAYVWLHGGGLVAGSAAADTSHCSRVAAELGIPVVAVDYRLAPEDPFPAALEDARATLRWVLDGAADAGVDPARIAIGGASAGGGLAAAVCQLVRDLGEPGACLQVLRYPMLDHRTRRGRTWRRYAWSPASNRFAWRCYLGAEVDAGADPPAYAVPALARDLAGLPPAWIGIGEADLFHDEARRYAARLVADGVPTVFDAVPGMYHGAEGTAPDAPAMRAFVAREMRALGDGVAGMGQTSLP
ncbi:alpha/beta hydrolase [Nocardioides panacisoli]|uniref:alpha/beta hydrolase n=1 Tax=Nocardioides panacisoli TaxID=627624 RepID=UPI001C626365|nr:alpha/beta hydrolase [Nocardioides panacisoli]QYJ05692.1 alpha/beta hydrolase [Nocardioides panacisoli]